MPRRGIEPQWNDQRITDYPTAPQRIYIFIYNMGKLVSRLPRSHKCSARSRSLAAAVLEKYFRGVSGLELRSKTYYLK